MREVAELRVERQLRLGALLVVLAGVVLLVATLLPWTAFDASFVNGDPESPEGVRSISGWDLTVECAHRSFPGACIVRDPNDDGSSEWLFNPDRVIAGDWALLAGALLVTAGLMIVPMRSREGWSNALVVAVWIIGLASIVCGVITLAELQVQRNGVGAGVVKVGVWVAIASPAFALVGIGLVQTARARARTRDDARVLVEDGVR